MTRAPFDIDRFSVEPGTRQTVPLQVSVTSDGTPVVLTVQVIHGARPGPTVFVSAAIHGDEVIGVEIARRLLAAPQLGDMAGTLLVVPIVNTLGFLGRARYLPDRRDLNRCFPGSARGSLGARLAHLFMTEIVNRCDLGIDLHSAAIHRTNLPQIRVSSASRDTLDLATTFGAPLVMRAGLRDGSLRAAAREAECDMLLFEAGEALRFDEMSARVGVTGCLRVLAARGMIDEGDLAPREVKPVIAQSSSWVRAPRGGLLRLFRETGDMVEEGETVAIVSDPLGDNDTPVTAPSAGLVIGRATSPIVDEGDAVCHIADVPVDDTEERIAQLAAELEADPLFDDDDEIV